MAAAQTKGHEEDKHTGMQAKNKKIKERKTKGRKQAQKQARKSYSRRLHGNTLPHHLPSSLFCSCRQRYNVSLLPLSTPLPPPVNKSTKTKQAAWTRGLYQLRFHLLVEPVPCHTICHFVSAFVDSCISTTPPPPVFPYHRSWRPLLRGVASSSPPRPSAISS